MIRIREISLPPEHNVAQLSYEAARLLRLSNSKIRGVRIVKRSVDARKKPDVRIVYTVDVKVDGNEQKILKQCGSKRASIAPVSFYKPPRTNADPAHRPVVVGFGPAGMFAALILAQAGLRPLVLERGEDAQSRHEKVEQFFAGGQLDPKSNVQFGEGGAGTFSDGKLNTGVNNPLTGFEFAAGIPGTIGGAVVMNAGAYGGEMKDVLETVTVLTPEGEILELANEELELGYRTSVVAKKEYIVLGAVIKLEHGDKEAIKEKMTELKIQRTTKQPLEYPSAGSTFKRPVGYFAGKLIQDAGLRGFQVGGAQVSEKHCGFVINKDNATAADIVELMNQVSNTVKEKFDVELEAEVKRLGEF